jgi:hypothetical protein
LFVPWGIGQQTRDKEPLLISIVNPLATKAGPPEGLTFGLERDEIGCAAIAL